MHFLRLWRVYVNCFVVLSIGPELCILLCICTKLTQRCPVQRSALTQRCPVQRSALTRRCLRQSQKRISIFICHLQKHVQYAEK